MMKKYMMTVAASLMVAGNLFAVEEVMVTVDHQHTHGVQEHKHTHEIIVKNNNGPTFEEMINQAKYTIVPGFHTGVLEGFTQGVVAISKEKLEEWKNLGQDLGSPYNFLVQNDIYLMSSIADTADFVSYFIGDVLRKDPEQCTQRPEGAFTPYLGEKIVHNMFKFAAALATIEAVGLYNNQNLGYESKSVNGDIKKQKAILIESYINTLFRDRNIVGEPYVKMLWNALLRGITEGVTVVTHNGTKKITFNAQGAAASVASVIASEIVVKGSFGKKMQLKNAKRLERLFSNILTAYFKNMFKVAAGKNSLSIENEASSLLALPVLGGVAVATLLGWGIQHQYVQAVVKFFADLTIARNQRIHITH